MEGCTIRVVNIHERQIAAPAAAVGALLDSLASDHDALWPGTDWPPMRLDRPLGEGATGGHGPVAYRVTRYLPGRLVEFAFLGPRGFHGGHVFEVEPIDAAATRLRHTIRANLTGPALVTWPVAIATCTTPCSRTRSPRPRRRWDWRRWCAPGRRG